LIAEVWSQIAGPYRAVARELGFTLLEERINDWKTSFTCIDLWYRDGTYMDLVGAVVTEGQPPGVAPGFNFVQMRTFVRARGRVHEVYSVGNPDPAPRAFGANAWVSQNLLGPFFNFVFRMTDRSVKLHVATDLRVLEQAHREQLGARQPIVGENPLELRWALQDEMERQIEIDEDGSC
jgi:hypothetical protein